MRPNRFFLGLIVIFVCFFVIWLIFNFSEKPPKKESQRSDKIKIVASFFVLADFAQKIGGDKVSVEILFTQTPEVSSLNARDIAKLREADLILINGVDFEVALVDILKSNPLFYAKAINTSDGIELIDNDPHIWLDPYRAFLQAQNIKNALIKIDPKNQDYYLTNFERLAREINDLDLKIAASLEPIEKKDLISFHNAFIYFNARYNLNKIATIEEFTGKEPSVSYLAGVIDKIKQFQVKAIFSEPQFSPKIITTLAKDLGLKVFSLDPLETGDLKKESYISKMEQNLNSLIQAFTLNH